MSTPYDISARCKGAAFLLATLLASTAWAGDWSLKDKEGVRYTLSGLQGKWVLVNFWAPWCPSCIQEMPDLISLQKKHENMQVIGVAVMYRTKKEVLDVAQGQAVSYPIVLGSEDIASDFGGFPGLPASFLYAPSGKLVGRHDGPLSQAEVEQAIGGNSTAFAR